MAHWVIHWRCPSPGCLGEALQAVTGVDGEHYDPPDCWECPRLPGVDPSYPVPMRLVGWEHRLV